MGGREKLGLRPEGSALFTLPRSRAMLKLVVVLPLQVAEKIRESLHSLARLGGELMNSRIIDRSGGNRDLIGAAQQRTSVAEERLCLLGRLRRRTRLTQVGWRVLIHGDSVPHVPATEKPLATPRSLTQFSGRSEM